MRTQDKFDREVLLCAADSIAQHGPMAEIAFHPPGHHDFVQILAADLLAQAIRRPVMSEEPVQEMVDLLRHEKRRVQDSVHLTHIRPPDHDLQYAAVHEQVCNRLLLRLEEGLA